MADINVISLTGRLTKDAEKKTFPSSGKAFMTFDIANNTGYGDFESTQYFKCIIVDKRAESLSEYLVKGKQVAITGILERNDWTDKDGRMVRDWQLKVDQLSMIGGSRQQSQGTFSYDRDSTEPLTF